MSSALGIPIVNAWIRAEIYFLTGKFETAHEWYSAKRDETAVDDMNELRCYWLYSPSIVQWYDRLSIFSFCSTFEFAGSVWVYGIKDDYTKDDPTQSTYCYSTLYHFAFWVITSSYILCGVSCCAGCCKGGQSMDRWRVFDAICESNVTADLGKDSLWLEWKLGS